MSKTNITLQYKHELGLINIGDCYDLKVDSDTCQYLMNTLKREVYVQPEEVHKDCHCPIFLFNAGIMAAIIAPLTIHYHPLGLIGIPIGYLVAILIWYRHHWKKIKAVQNYFDLSEKVYRETDTKVELVYSFSAQAMITNIQVRLKT